MTSPATPTHGTTRGRLVVVLLAFLAGATALLAVPSTHGALTGRVNNTGNTVASSVYATGTCNAAVRAAPRAQAAYPFNDLVGVAATNVITTTAPGTYTATGVTYGVAGPCPRDTATAAVTLDGARGFVRALAATNPQTFSVQVWFRTTTGSGGKLFGFGDNTGISGQSSNYDRHVYMTNDGRLVFGVYPNAVRTVTSPASYNDGQWHHVVATLGPSGATAGMRLYVDGSLVANDTGTTTAQVFNGTWRFGYDNIDNWVLIPSSEFFAGSLAYGAIWTSALTAAQVSTLYSAGR